MQVRKLFIDYINHLPPKLAQKSAKIIHKGAEGQIGLLGRIFNEFPDSYIAENKNIDVTTKTYSALEPKQQAEFLTTFRSIIADGKFETISHPEESSIKITILANETQRAASVFLKEMISAAVAILLDERGDMNPDVEKAVGLGVVLKPARNRVDNIVKLQQDRKRHDSIIFQIVYSFVSQIILGNILGLLDKEFKEQHRGEYDETTISPTQKITALSKFVELECMKIVPGKGGVIMPLFKRAVTEALYDKSSYSIHIVADYLRHMAPNDITETVKRDLFKFEVNLRPQLTDELFMARQQFWLEVLSELEKSEDYIEMESILNILPESVSYNRHTRKKIDSSSSSITGISSEQKIAAINDALPKAISEGDILSQDSHTKYLSRWFNTRDNNFLIGYLLHQEVRPKIHSSIFKNHNKLKSLFETLKDYQFKSQFMELPSARFLEIIHDQVKEKKEFLKILQNHAPDIAVHLKQRMIDLDSTLKPKLSK